MQTFDVHPAALQYAPGGMSDDEIAALVVDMQKHGQRVPATLYEGKLLDGRARSRACARLGLTLKTVNYTGTSPADFVIALNLLRRITGASPRALAGARLCTETGLTQDAAAKQVGVSKVHVNLAVQALQSKNMRIIKLLEDPKYTRERLNEDLVDCGIKNPSQSRVPAPLEDEKTDADLAFDRFVQAAGGMIRHPPETDDAEDLDDDLLDIGEPVQFKDLESDDDPADVLISPSEKPAKPSKKPTEEAVRTTPIERRPRENPVQQLAERFRGSTEADQVVFLQTVWPIAKKLLIATGLISGDVLRPASSASTPAEIAATAISGAKASAGV